MSKEAPSSSAAQAFLREAPPLLRLAGPVALAQVGMNSLTLVDTAIVGNDSTLDFEAATLGRSLTFMVASIGLGIGMALEPLASQALAADEPDRAWGSLRKSLLACFIQWPFAVLATFTLTLALPALRVAPPEVSGARQFLLGNAPGLLFFVLFIATKTFLQAHKRTTPLIAGAIVANLVNFVACSLLVRGDAALIAWGLAPRGLPHLGPLGAGLANSLAALVLFLWTYVAARQHRAVGLNPVPSLRRIYALGIPMGLQLLAEIGAFTLAALLCAWFGAAEVGAYQVAIMLASQTFMAALGVSGATAVQVGRAVGEGRNARAPGFTGIVLGAAFMLVGVLLFTTIPGTLVRMFSKDPAVIERGVLLLRLAAIFQLFDGVQAVAAGALRGAGDVKHPFVANVVAHWAIGFPIAMGLAFGLGWGALGLWMGLTAGLISVALALALRFWRISGQQIARA